MPITHDENVVKSANIGHSTQRERISSSHHARENRDIRPNIRVASDHAANI
jgi:hypothetical protein